MGKTDSFGPNIVHEPTDTSSIVADICFVHGLGGHREDTWTEKKGKGSCFWPKELLSTDIGNVRIITWGYNTAVFAFFGTDSKESLQELGYGLINDLSMLRKREVRERPLIFVAHSLGGLVVKQAIIQSNTHYNNKSSNYGDMFPAVKCAMFLATPHRGSDAANWAHIISNITKPLAISLASKELMKTLKSDSCALYNQRETFLAVRHSVDLDVPCFYENIPTSKIMIVPKDFAVIEDCHTRIAMDANHHGICKFNNKNDVNYQRFLNEIQMAVEKIETERGRAAEQMQERLEREAREIQESTARVSRQETDDLLKSLYFADMDRVPRRIENALAGTFEWLFEQQPSESYWPEHEQSDHIADFPKFLSWVHSPQSLFWITGKPASGKSTMMKYIYNDGWERLTQHLKQWTHGDLLIPAAFFIRNTSESQLSRCGSGLLRSLLYQLLRHPELEDIVKSAFAHSPSSLRSLEDLEWSWEQLKSAFILCLSQKPSGVKLFLLVDGLDELNSLEERDQGEGLPNFAARVSAWNTMMELLIRASKFPGIKICLSSRPFSQFEKHFTESSRLEIHRLTAGDIKKFTESVLEKDDSVWQNLAEQTVDPRERISRMIQTRAEGVFMWVKIAVRVVNANLDYASFEEIEQMLKSFPGELASDNGLYAQALSNYQDGNNRDTGLRMLYHLYDFNNLESSKWSRETPMNPSILHLAEKLDGREDQVFESTQTAHTILSSKKEWLSVVEKEKKRIWNYTAGLLECRHTVYRTGSIHGGDTNGLTVTWAHETVREFLERKDRSNMAMWDERPGRTIDKNESSTRVAIAFLLFDFRQSFIPHRPDNQRRWRLLESLNLLATFRDTRIRDMGEIAAFKIPKDMFEPSMTTSRKIKWWFLRNILTTLIRVARCIEPHLLQGYPDEDSKDLEFLEERLLITCLRYGNGMLMVFGSYEEPCMTANSNRPLLDIYLSQLQTGPLRSVYMLDGRDGVHMLSELGSWQEPRYALHELQEQNGTLSQSLNIIWGRHSIWHRYLQRSLAGGELLEIDILMAHNPHWNEVMTMTWEDARELEELAAEPCQTRICEPAQLWAKALDRPYSVACFVALVILWNQEAWYKLPELPDLDLPGLSGHLLEIQNMIQAKEKSLEELLQSKRIYTKTKDLESEATESGRTILSSLNAMRSDLLSWISTIQRHQFCGFRPGELESLQAQLDLRYSPLLTNLSWYDFEAKMRRDQHAERYRELEMEPWRRKKEQ